MPVTWGWNVTRGRVNEGLPWERGVRRNLQEGKAGYLLVESDGRETMN